MAVLPDIPFRVLHWLVIFGIVSIALGFAIMHYWLDLRRQEKLAEVWDRNDNAFAEWMQSTRPCPTCKGVGRIAHTNEQE